MKKNLILIILTLFISAACDDDLKLTPISSISFESFFQNPDDAQAALNGMYAQMRVVGNGLYLYGDWRADNTINTDLGTGSDVNRNEIRAVTPGTDWTQAYRLINDANLILKRVPGIEFTNQDDQDDILAQAYFARAWIYFQIVRIWGDAPLLTEGFDSPTQEGILPELRDQASEIWVQVKDDVQKAIDLFPVDGITSRYQGNAVAANILKADIYLWTAKLEGGGNSDLNIALEAINSVVSATGLELLPNYEDVFRPTVATSEDIFSLYWDIIENAGGWWTAQYNLSDSFWNALPPEEQEKIPFIQGSVRFYTSTQLLRDQIAENSALGNGATDSREALYFLEYNDPSGELRWIMNKYQGEEIGANLRQFTDDMKIYRLADAILMKAEILNALDQTGAAIDELNKTRNRAGIGDYAGAITKEAVDDAIMRERGVELAFEAKRFFDLVRFGKAYEIIPTLIGRENDQPILWPINVNTIAQNPNLSQTQGY